MTLIAHCPSTQTSASLRALAYHARSQAKKSQAEGRVRIRSTRRTANLLLLLSCYLPLTVGEAASASTISYVQASYATPQTATSTVSIKYRSAQTAGDLNVVVIGWNDSTTTVKTISDSLGNSYSLAIGPTIVSGALSQSIYFAKNIVAAAAGANSVTVTFSHAAIYADVRILEYMGTDPNSPVDVVAASSGTSTITSVSAKTINASDLIFAANIVQTTTTGTSAGFTRRLLTQPDGDIAEDQMVTVAGSHTASAPLSGGGSWIMQMVAFQTSASSSGSPAPALTALSCASSAMTGAGTDTCTVAISAAAATGGLTVSLASNNASVSVPSSVTVAAGASSASFPAAVSVVSTAQTVTLTASASDVSQAFALQLNAAAATLGISATSISFGSVDLNTPATQSIVLTATGTLPVTVNSATTSATSFSISEPSLPMVLNPNQTATVSVEFDPTTAGTVTGVLAIASNSSSNPTATVNLSGTGVATSYSVRVTWDAPSSSPDPVDSYNIYRSPNGSSSYQLMGSVNNGTLSYTDTNNIQNGQAYDYVVESVDAFGNKSIPSNMASVIVE